MLLYTRLAPPKVPKKRSRAGCSYCKEKKKKCDEVRPKCSRCQEHDQDCVYEAVKPRQRRKREPVATPLAETNSSSSGSDNAHQSPYVIPDDSQWNQETQGIDGSFDASTIVPVTTNQNLIDDQTSTPLDSLFSWSPRELPILSPLSSLDFRFPVNDTTCIAQGQDEDVEEIIRQNSLAFVSPTIRSTRTPSLALIAPVPAPSPLLEFCSPAFAEFSDRTNRRGLVDHFCNILSHLIVFREERGNPFQQLVLPLCQNSPSVMNAVYALASAHLEYRGIENGERSVLFHNKSIQGLARLIEKGAAANRNELLAAIMLLVYYEVLVQKGRSNIVDGHLKGALTIMGHTKASTDPTGVFLERAFRFYDVIAALSFGTSPLSTDPGGNYLSPFPPLDSTGASSPLNSIDTLLGMATSLWPIIHRLSNLLTLKEQLDAAVSRGELTKVAVLTTEFDISASSIETALKEWQPILPPESALHEHDEDMSAARIVEGSRLQSILNNALAYRHSAFVYLYRTIYGYPREHPLVQSHTHISLSHCIGTVKNAGPMSALLWPLFVASCEATTPEDRDLAQETFFAINRRQGMRNIERAWCIVQEVWKRADKAELLQQEEPAKLGGKGGGDLWRRVSEEMGVTIVFG